MNTLNQVYSSLSVRRRYEVWFLRMGLAGGSGAWWFRYLLVNPARNGCPADPRGMPVQVWATWFPTGGRPQSFIRGFAVNGLELSNRGSPLRFAVEQNGIGENSCFGRLNVDGHTVSWELKFSSTFGVTLSDKGWIGFSRTPHSNATFSGHVLFDGRKIEGQPLGFGLQGHNCGYRHRSLWTWAHAFFPHQDANASTLEALIYEMPLGLKFRKAVLWHHGKQYIFRKFLENHEDPRDLQWKFRCAARDGCQLDVALDGRGPSLHRLPYLKTNCSGSFEVANNSLSSVALRLETHGNCVEQLESVDGAVLEMGGQR